MSDDTARPDGQPNYPIAVLRPIVTSGPKKKFKWWRPFANREPEVRLANGMAFTNQRFPMGRQMWSIYDSFVFFQVSPKDIELARNGTAEERESAFRYIQKSMDAMTATFEGRGWPKEYLNQFKDTIVGMRDGVVNPTAYTDAVKRYVKDYGSEVGEGRFDFDRSSYFKEESGWDRPYWTITRHELFRLCDEFGLQLFTDTQATMEARAQDAFQSQQPASGVTGLGIRSTRATAMQLQKEVPKSDLDGMITADRARNADMQSNELAYFRWIGAGYSRTLLPVVKAVEDGQLEELGQAFKVVGRVPYAKNSHFLITLGKVQGAAVTTGAAVLLGWPIVKVLPSFVHWTIPVGLAAIMLPKVAAWGFRHGERAHDAVLLRDFRNQDAPPDRFANAITGLSIGSGISTIAWGVNYMLSPFFNKLPKATPSSVFLPDRLQDTFISHFVPNISAGTMALVLGPIIAGGFITWARQLNRPEIPSQSGSGEHKMLPALVAMNFTRGMIIAGATAAYVIGVNVADYLEHLPPRPNTPAVTLPAAAPGVQPGPTPTPIQPPGGGQDNRPSGPDWFQRTPPARPAEPEKRGGELRPLPDPSNGSRMGMNDAAKDASRQIAQRIETGNGGLEFHIQTTKGVIVAYVPARTDKLAAAPQRTFAKG